MVPTKTFTKSIFVLASLCNMVLVQKILDVTSKINSDTSDEEVFIQGSAVDLGRHHVFPERSGC